LGDTVPAEVLPPKVPEVVKSLDYFIVENLRNARRFMIKCGYDKPIDSAVFYELNQHTSAEEIPGFLGLCKDGRDCGMISEAGIPGIADPGAEVAAIAHRAGIQVIPLSGPSSIFMALMASGLNGQHFTFHGYLPASGPERARKLRELESIAQKTGQSQVFMETPYRNEAILSEIIKTCNGSTMLCIACDISLLCISGTVFSS
jgi:16S rRNA (cytidine1402-2'-O)-methyltransferase